MDWTHIPDSSVYWEYEWSVNLDQDDQRLSQPVGNQRSLGLPDEVFSVHLQREKGRIVQVGCIVRQSLLEQQLGCDVKVVTCGRPDSNFRFEHQLPHVTEVGAKSTAFQFHRLGGDLETPNQTFTFRFYLSASLDQFTHDRVDSHLVNKLWEAAVNEQLTDVKFQVETRTFSAHKFVLAARSPVFQAMFSTDMIESRTGRIDIHDVDPDIFEQLLYFIYTGQPMDRPVSVELGELADRYLVESLAELSRIALASSPSVADEGSPRKIPKESPITVGLTESYEVQISEAQLNQLLPVDDSGLFQFKVELANADNDHKYIVTLSTTRRAALSGFKVSYAEFKDEGIIIAEGDGSRHFWNCWASIPGSDFQLMDRSPTDEEVFTISTTGSSIRGSGDQLIFRFVVHLMNRTESLRYQFRDAHYKDQLWSCSVNKEWTDVEFVLGDRTFSAHRALLAARCPALLLVDKVIGDVDPDIFEALLHFLYTGTLKILRCNDDEGFFETAKKFQIISAFGM